MRFMFHNPDDVRWFKVRRIIVRDQSSVIIGLIEFGVSI